MVLELGEEIQLYEVLRSFLDKVNMNQTKEMLAIEYHKKK